MFFCVIVGKGRFAQSLLENAPLVAEKRALDYSFVSWDEIDIGEFFEENSKNTAILHVGSGRQLPEAVALCSAYSMPLIQASTGVDFDLVAPLHFSFVHAPNLAIPIIKFCSFLQKMGKGLAKNTQVTITESHQAEKTTTPGTAVMIAEALGLEPSQIKSVRDSSKQLDLGIAKDHLAAHAAHWIEIDGLGVKLSFKSEVYGHFAYAEGLVQLLGSLNKLENSVYEITDLVDKSFF